MRRQQTGVIFWGKIRLQRSTASFTILLTVPYLVVNHGQPMVGRIDQFEICGPLMVLITEFCKQQKTR